MQKDIEFIKAFFSKLNNNNIKYCILRKAKEILEGKAHDIDMVIEFSKIDEVFMILETLAKKMQWKLFFKAVKDNGNLITVHYFCINEDKIEIIHFDFFNNFSWSDIPLIKNKQLLSECILKEGVYCCSNVNEGITKLFSRYLYHGYIKDEYKEEIIDIFKNNKEKTLNSMEEFLDIDYSEILYDLIINEKWHEITELSYDIRRNIKNKYFKSSYKRLNHILSNVLFKIKRYFKYSGIMVAFIGTDGSGKSTIIEHLPLVLGRTFDESQIKYYHWRPKYLKSPKKNNSTNHDITNPHKKKPYNKFISFLKFMYFNVDYIVGYWFSVKINLGRNKLVIFDRYYYDYLIDKYRYRLDLNDKFIEWMIKVIPKPDITFLLVGDPKILYERKKELTLLETEKQINKILGIKNKVPNAQEIDVNQDIECVVNKVCSMIIEKCANKYD